MLRRERTMICLEMKMIIDRDFSLKLHFLEKILIQMTFSECFWRIRRRNRLEWYFYGDGRYGTEEEILTCKYAEYVLWVIWWSILKWRIESRISKGCKRSRRDDFCLLKWGIWKWHIWATKTEKKTLTGRRFSSWKWKRLESTTRERWKRSTSKTSRIRPWRRAK